MAVSPRSRILRSVFPSTALATGGLTPQATPLFPQGSFNDGQPATQILHSDSSNDPAAEKIRWERSWHLATTFILEQLHAGENQQAVPKCPSDVHDAIRYLQASDSVGWRLRAKSQADDLIWWYSQVIQRLFLSNRLPTLVKMIAGLTDDLSSVKPLTDALIQCRESLLRPHYSLIAPVLTTASSTLEESYKALVAESLQASLEPKLQPLVTHLVYTILDADKNDHIEVEDSMQGVENLHQHQFTDLLMQTVSGFAQGGLSRRWIMKLAGTGFRRAISRLITELYARRWSSPSTCVDEIKDFIAGPVNRLAAQTLRAEAEGSGKVKKSMATLLTSDIAEWKELAVNQLGALRLTELFDIVVDWDTGSKGGIEDLRHFVTDPMRRWQVVNYFIDVLFHRLLIPGASTTEILQIYVRVIRALAILDNRHVILDRVSRPIRRYLRDRDDTVKIIINGLLADTESNEPPTDALVELATELYQMDVTTANEEDVGIDWDDMTWMPNPTDAEPDFNRSKDRDIIGALLSLFDNKEIFVREFQNILGERLLGSGVTFERELRVLELLKSRFGEAALQGCEVMVKDVSDSRRTDVIVKDKRQIKGEDNQEPEIYTKILSKFFWPELRDESFKIPPQIQALHDRYSDGFEEHKSQRKLAWLPALGQATVELQLKHRTVRELVTTWQASIIHAFASEDDSDSSEPPCHKTAAQLADELEMDPDLVSNALTFWVSKLVLYEPVPGTYEVLEVLPTEEDAESVAGEQKASADIVAAAQNASAAAAASAASAVRSEEELAEEKMEVVWQYVVGMLTNQGAMPLQQMVMMLNFVVPGGFAHSNEEFRAFLQKRVDDGRLEMAGASYKIPKK